MTSLSNTESLARVVPELCLMLGFVSALVATLVRDTRRQATARTAAALCITLAIVATVFGPTGDALLFYSQFRIDAASRFFRLASAATALVTVVAGGPRPKSQPPEIPALVCAVAAGMNLMAISDNLLPLYVAVEFVSLGSYALSGMNLESRKSAEACLKYVVYGGTSSAVMLYGMSWLYGLGPSLSLSALHLGAETPPAAYAIGLAFTLGGLLFKTSAAPFHMWAPDVYEGAPTLITAFLSTGPKVAGFAALLRLTAARPGEPISDLWAILLGFIAIASMVWGNLAALRQRSVKRMLAYSGVAHSGFMLLCLASQRRDGGTALLFYALTYAVANFGAFLVVLHVTADGDDGAEVFRGLGMRCPPLALLLSLFLLSLTGIPPFAGFPAKAYVFASLVAHSESLSGWYAFLAVVGLGNTVLGFAYYARVVGRMYLTRTVSLRDPPRVRAHTLAAAGLAAPLVWLGIYWNPVYSRLAHAFSER